MTRWSTLLSVVFAAAAVSWIVSSEEAPQRGTAESPAAFEVSRYNDSVVYVHLHGGAANFGPGAGRGAKTGATVTGKVHGRVLDRDGHPLAGVLVAGGEDLIMLHDSLRAQDGVWTDDEGYFAMKTYGDEVSLVALHHERGMSRAPTVPVDSHVELTLEPFTWIEGTVHDGANPVEARLVVQSEGEHVALWSHADASGSYKLGPLPPGSYEIRVDAPDPDEVIAFPVDTLELRPGTTTEHSVTETGPGSVWVEFHRTPGLRVAVTGIALFEGAAPIRSEADYEAIVRGEVDRAFYGETSLGPSHPRKRFRGLPLGPYTACMRLNLSGEDMHVTCQTVAVDGDRAAEVEFQLAAG